MMRNLLDTGSFLHGEPSPVKINRKIKEVHPSCAYLRRKRLRISSMGRADTWTRPYNNFPSPPAPLSKGERGDEVLLIAQLHEISAAPVVISSHWPDEPARKWAGRHPISMGRDAGGTLAPPYSGMRRFTRFITPQRLLLDPRRRGIGAYRHTSRTGTSLSRVMINQSEKPLDILFRRE